MLGFPHVLVGEDFLQGAGQKHVFGPAVLAHDAVAASKESGGGGKEKEEEGGGDSDRVLLVFRRRHVGG